MLQVAIGLYDLQQWYGGDFAPVERGRDPKNLAVRALLQTVWRADGRPDLDATLAGAPALAAAGATVVETLPLTFCRSPDGFGAFCRRLVEVKREVSS